MQDCGQTGTTITFKLGCIRVMNYFLQHLTLETFKMHTVQQD